MTDPQFNAMLANLRILLAALGAVMAREGYEHTTAYSIVIQISGSILVIGPLARAAYSSFVNWRKASAAGVQAGINLTVSGKALASDGKTVVSENDGTTPPLAVTLATAAEIVKDFAPPTASIAKA